MSSVSCSRASEPSPEPGQPGTAPRADGRHPSAEPMMPRHQRIAPSFGSLLGVPAGRVIEAMDAAGDDIPHQVPRIRIELPSVGLDRRNVPVRIADPFGSGADATLSCTVRARTGVPADKRGIHTSRIGRLVADASLERYPDLQSYATRLARAIHDAEYGLRCEVEVGGVLSYVEEVAGWTETKDKRSLEQIEIGARAVIEDERVVQHASLAVNHITACPCVQQTYKHALQEAKGDVRDALSVVAPLLTHSQRCRTRVELEDLDGPLPLAVLLDTLDRVVYRVQNTLPREHELALVYRAHRSPQFIEDAVRQVLAGVRLRLGERFPASRVRVQSVSYESIHDYDIAAEIELPMAALGSAAEVGG
jgi:GTP cyclohydrolase FolE2